MWMRSKECRRVLYHWVSPSLSFDLFFFFLKEGSHCVALVGLEFLIFLLQTPSSWDYRHKSQNLVKDCPSLLFEHARIDQILLYCKPIPGRGREWWANTENISMPKIFITLRPLTGDTCFKMKWVPLSEGHQRFLVTPLCFFSPTLGLCADEEDHSAQKISIKFPGTVS